MAYVDDVAEITALAHTYGARAGDLDAAGQSATFTDDAEFAGISGLLGRGEAPLVGREEIARFLGDSHRVVEFLHQHNQVTDVVVDGDRATARTQLTEVAGLTDGPLLMLLADLDDELRREEGCWLYARRTITPKTLRQLTELPLGRP